MLTVAHVQLAVPPPPAFRPLPAQLLPPPPPPSQQQQAASSSTASKPETAQTQEPLPGSSSLPGKEEPLSSSSEALIFDERSSGSSASFVEEPRSSVSSRRDRVPQIFSSSKQSSSVQSSVRSSVAIQTTVTISSVHSSIASVKKIGRSSSLPKSSIAYSRSSSERALVIDMPPQKPPSIGLFTRERWFYTEPIVPLGSMATPRSVSLRAPLLLKNILLALLTVAVFGLSALLFQRRPLSPGARQLLRRLPLSLAVFLLLFGLKQLFVPDALAQTGSSSALPPMSILVYGLAFFVIAGLTNFLANNMLAAEVSTLEGIFSWPGRDSSHAWKRSALVIALFFLFYAAIGAHINTSFSLLPLKQPGITLIALLTIIAAAYAKDGLRFALAPRLRLERWMEANFVGLLLAILSIVLTRNFGLSPGYLFGIPAGVFITATHYQKHEGPFEWAGLLSMLGVAAIAWLLLPLTTPAPVIGDFLRLLVVILLEACFFESLPFPYLAGLSVYRWRKSIWALQCFITSFLVFHLLWNPKSTVASVTASPPTATYLLLLGLYVLAVLTLFFVLQKRHNAGNF